jgi:trehalose utilization protein
MSTSGTKKGEKTKVDSFKTWLDGKLYWEQFLWRLHIEKGTLEEADIEKVYQYLLEDSGVIDMASGRTSIVFTTFVMGNNETKQGI